MRRSMYDVMVVGGGIVGAAAALGLARQTALKVAMIEASTLPIAFSKTTHAQRVSALSLRSQQLFEMLEVWGVLPQDEVAPYHKMRIWDAESTGNLQFESDQLALPSLGYIVTDAALRFALLDQVAQNKNIDIIAPVKLVGLQQSLTDVVLSTDTGDVLCGSLVIAADGAHSWVRAQIGANIKSWQYDQKAIVATVKTELPHDSTAWQRFLATGPLAFLPLHDKQHCSIVWSTSPADADFLLSLDDNAFQKKCTAAFDGQLGSVEVKSPRQGFDLVMRHVSNYVHSRVVLVGDAAHTIHPLAGQGVNMGLQDVCGVLDTISTILSRSRDLADHALWRRYERARKADNAKMLLFVDVIKKLFISNALLMRPLRGASLNATNNLRLLKDFFIRQAV